MTKLVGNDIVYVHLMNEGSDAWRPVPSRHMSGDMYVLGNVEGVISEEWEFAPGTLVKVAKRTFRNGASGLVAVAQVAQQGDRFTFSMLIRTPPSIELRLSLLRELPDRLPLWVGQPEEVMFLDPYSRPEVQAEAAWSDAEPALNRPLDENTMAFVYYGTSSVAPWRSIVEVSEYARSSVYNVTIPASVYHIKPHDVSSVMIELHHWLESNQRNTFIVGGDLSVTKEWAEDPDGPRRAAEDHYAEWLCCMKSDVHSFLDRFEVIAEAEAVAVCRRRRR